MSLYDYKMSIQISKDDPPFYGIIMSAFRQADTDNLNKLRSAFPGTYKEFIDRYNAPGGVLERDKVNG